MDPINFTQNVAFYRLLNYAFFENRAFIRNKTFDFRDTKFKDVIIISTEITISKFYLRVWT